MSKMQLLFLNLLMHKYEPNLNLMECISGVVCGAHRSIIMMLIIGDFGAVKLARGEYVFLKLK